MASRLILIGGGARSGKSAFALRHAQHLGSKPTFIATAQAYDDEMRTRINHHQIERGGDFVTVEEPQALAQAIGAAPGSAVIVVDCLTLWLSNRLCADVTPDVILAEVDQIIRVVAARSGPTLLVTNEVGLGIVPDNALSRAFRDLTGHAHQRLAAVADEIYAGLMGVVLRLHPGPVEVVRASRPASVASSRGAATV